MKITVILDRIEEQRAVFISPDKKEIIIPTTLFDGENIRPGDSVVLALSPEGDVAAENKALAKRLLNEILSS
ncbi:MAG: hypothetical protein ACOZBH_00730 [Patescibacteria group bacterium]